jgi:hypothetical protein
MLVGGILMLAAVRVMLLSCVVLAAQWPGPAAVHDVSYCSWPLVLVPHPYVCCLFSWVHSCTADAASLAAELVLRLCTSACDAHMMAVSKVTLTAIHCFVVCYDMSS